jgi:Ca2+-binding EF-hand superfamily protein
MSASFLTFSIAGLCTLLLATALAEAGGRGAMFDKLDLDNDGLVTRSEAVEARARWFENVDADADGYLTLEEMSAQRRHGGAEGKAGRIERRFAKLDRDGDGRLSQAEFTAKSGHWIDRADGDGDGAISREEWREAAERRKRKAPEASAQ